MVILGLVLLAAVAVVTVAVVQAGGDPVALDLSRFTIHTNGTTLFLAGAFCLLLLVLALLVLRTGIRRARVRHREMRELRQRAFEVTPSTGGGSTRSSTPAAGSSRKDPDADDYVDTSPRD